MTGPDSHRPMLASGIAAVACLLAIWSMLPLAMWWDAVPPSYFAGTWQIWGLGSAIVGLVVFLVLRLTGDTVPSALSRAWHGVLAIPRPLFLAATSAGLAIVTVLCTVFVFDGNPRNVDGFAQLFQARIFLEGRLWNTPPAELAHFATLQMILGPTKWLSQYPPGQSVLLAIGLIAGKWWLLNPFIAAVFALATWRVARWCTDESTARLTMILLCLAPFVVAVAASEMSHLAAATVGMSAAALAIMATERPLFGLGCGLLIGLMTLFRPLDAVAASVPAGVILLGWAAHRSRAIAGAVAGGLVGAIPTLWFNWVTNGSPATFGYTTLWGPQHSLGFHPVPWGEPLTLIRAIARSGMDLHQLNAYLLDSTVPVLLVVAVGFVAGRRLIGSRDAIPFVAVLSLLLPLFFYWHRDVFYGPRFLYSVVAWFVILLARGLVLLRRSGTADDRRGPGLTIAFAVLASIAFGLAFNTPDRIRIYRQSTPDFSLHPDRDAARAGVTQAVVLIPDGWGSRLIVRMWQLGVPVQQTNRIYASIDACTLEEALSAAERDVALRSRLGSTLDSLVALQQPGVRAGVTGDDNLRLRRDRPLSPVCVAEVDVDRRDFYSYAPYLWLNNADLDGDIVWARDLGPLNDALFRRYSDRKFYRYVPGPDRTPALVAVDGPGW